MSACIRADNLTLDVPTFLQRERSGSGWKDLFMGAAFDPPKRRVARLLENVSFEVGEGDRLAILGRNGAGKSTLLRVLNRVYQPTSGELLVSGSCQALLNMGLGFNNEATVRENVFLRGIAMGLKSAFLSRQADAIMEFAGLQDKANHRLHTLSSGQRLRLGFAISTSSQNDIMLMDEWLGTGDAEFVDRAKERMQDRVGGSKIVVLASHSIGLLNSLCNKAIVLDRGRLVHVGEFGAALKAYNTFMDRLQAQGTSGQDHLAAPVRLRGRVARLVERGEDFVVLEGWCVGDDGSFPGGLMVQLHGRDFPAAEVVAIKRPDVMKHLGLVHDDCGFRATFKLPGAAAMSDLWAMQVLAARGDGREGAPLRLSAEVVGQLEKPASGRR